MNQSTNVIPIPQRPIGPRPYVEVVKILDLGPILASRKAERVQRRANVPVSTGGNVIPESSRNTTLASLAGSMRHRNMSQEAIDAALQKENLARCEPPLDASEVSAIAASISKYPATDTVSALRSLTDVGNAARFGTRYKDELRYVPERGKWLAWDGQRWRTDDVGAVMERAKQVARDIYLEGDSQSDDQVRVAIARHAKGSQQAPRLKAMVDLAQSLPDLVAPLASLDADDMLLGVLNGVVDLRTGKLRAANREDLLTRQAPARFDPKAKCPTFDAFLRTIFKSDKAMIAFVQRVVGYALTGVTDEQCLFFLHGHGANGKSTLLNVLLELLGADYARQTPSETLMAKRRGDGAGASGDLARLQGVRVTTANEIEDGSLLAESLVKQITGGDVVVSRFLYREHFEFRPEFKLFIAGNHKPIITGTDDGMWRRIHPIPFEVQIQPGQRDPKLLEKLKAELPGILSWAIRGCQIWQKRGLEPPPKITNAAKAYRKEMDVLGQWIDEECTVSANARWRASEAYVNYRFWAEQNGFKAMTSTAFGRKLSERYARVDRSIGREYRGIGPRSAGAA